MVRIIRRLFQSDQRKVIVIDRKLPDILKNYLIGTDQSFQWWVEAVRVTQTWESPEPVRLQKFWLKWLQSSHELLAEQFQEVIESRSLTTSMTIGITFLFYKSSTTTDPKSIRHFTCLPTVYKLLTTDMRSNDR